MSRRATRAASRALEQWQGNKPAEEFFPSGPTFATEFRLTWDKDFFSQFAEWLIPYKVGVYGTLDGDTGWQWISGFTYSGPTLNVNQPIIIHSPTLQFDDATNYICVADVVTQQPGFPAVDAEGFLYWLDHDPLVVVRSVVGGGFPVAMDFQEWHAQVQV